MAPFSPYRETRASSSASDIRVAFDSAEVAGEWRRLEETGHATAFQTRRWLEPLMRIAAPAEGAEPFFVLVRERASGAPQMLLPLCLRRCGGGPRAIEFLDLGASDYNAPLISSGFRPSPSEFAALWSAIRAALPPADILRIDKSPATIAGAPNPLAHLRFMRRLALGAWSIALPRTREAYDREILSARFRKELRRKRRRLESCGALRIVRADDAGEARRMLRELADMRRDRYAVLGRHDILADDAFRAFYEDLLARDGLAEIHALEIDGLRVAIQFGLRRDGAFHFLLSGFRGDEWAQKSVGGVAADMMIAQAIEEGLATFDFTIGNAPYKRYFGAVRHDLFGGAQALSYRALPEVAERRIKGSLRKLLLPPPAEPRALSPGHWR